MVKCMLISDTHYGMDGKTHHKHAKFWRKVAKAIEDEGVQVLIWAGDLASFRQRHLRRSLEMANEAVKIPIVLVRGNHDFWDGIDRKDKNSTVRSLDQLFKLHEHWFKVNHIHHLEDNPFVIDDVIICGFDGWYGSANPNTNDKHWMPKFIQGEKQVMSYMSTKAWRDFEKCLEVDTSKYRKSILVTHHNIYPFDHSFADTNIELGLNYGHHSGNYRFLQEAKDKFDVLCGGHTHRYRNDYDEGIQIYNCGADYNKPKYLIFEV